MPFVPTGGSAGIGGYCGESRLRLKRSGFAFTSKDEEAVAMNGTRDQQRRSIERFVCRENIARFGRMLAAEHDESERTILSELIAEERVRQIDTMDQLPSNP